MGPQRLSADQCAAGAHGGPRAGQSAEGGGWSENPWGSPGRRAGSRPCSPCHSPGHLLGEKWSAHSFPCLGTGGDEPPAGFELITRISPRRLQWPRAPESTGCCQGETVRGELGIWPELQRCPGVRRGRGCEPKPPPPSPDAPRVLTGELLSTRKTPGLLQALSLPPTSPPPGERQYTCVRARACSVVPGSLGPQGLEPARPLCPWNSRLNAGVGWHFLIREIFLTQGSNPHLLRLLLWQADSLPAAPKLGIGEG